MHRYYMVKPKLSRVLSDRYVHGTYSRRSDILIRHIVSSSGQQTIALVSDQEDGYFCCGFGDNFWNGSSCTSESTRNNYDAFVLDPPTVIIDRADGLTLQNNPSHSSRPVVTVTTTAAGRTVTATPSSKPSNNKDVIAAGVGAAVPLGCLLAAAIAFLILGRRQVKRLKNENSTQKEEIEEQRRELESAWSQAKIGRAHVAGTNRNPAELEADRVAAELDNGERQSLVGERDTKHVYR